MTYKKYLSYLESLGLDSVVTYDYKKKNLNINNENERMLNRSIQMFKWHNLPVTIPEKQLELMLQSQGYAIIGMIDNRLYACYGVLGGELDEYFRPTKAIVNIPYFNFSSEWEIGKECVVIRNDTMLQGVLPLYSKYNTLMVETDITLMLMLVNMRVQAYISASDDRSIDSAEKFIDNLYKGELGIIADNKMFESVKFNFARDTQDIYKIREIMQYLKGQLYNEIGLATNYNLKKERVSAAEVELNTDNLYPFVDNMYECRKIGIKEILELFDLDDIEVEFSSSWDYRVLNGESIDIKGDNDGLVVDDFSDSTNDNIGENVISNDNRDDLSMESKVRETDTIDINDSGDISDFNNDNINDEFNDDIEKSDLLEVENIVVDIIEDIIDKGEIDGKN